MRYDNPERAVPREEMREVEAAAMWTGRSSQVVAHDAVMSAISPKKQRLREVSARGARIRAELNERLALLH